MEEACQRALIPYPTTPHSSRLSWARTNLILILRAAFDGIAAAQHVSDDVWIIIADELMPQFLTTRALRLPLELETTGTEITLALPIFYKTTRIDYKTYVNWIANEETVGATRADPGSPPPEAVYIAHDTFGITEIVTTSRGQAPPAQRVEGQWWTTVAVDDTPLLRFSGTLVLRDVDTVPPSPRKPPSFPIPHAPCALRFERLHGDREAHLFDFFDCNAPDVIGYSAYCKLGLETIITHKRDQPPDYKSAEARATSGSWIFAPVDVGETITEIWKHFSVTTQASLAFRTSKGRVIVFGPYPILAGSRWELIDEPCTHGSRIFYNKDSPIEVLAFSSEAPLKRDPEAVVPYRNLYCRIRTSLIAPYYSEATLSGATELIPCYLGGFLTGMILVYEGGHQRALGQVRLDALTTSIRLNPSTPVTLQFTLTDKLLPSLWGVSSDPKAHGVRLIGSGMLKWWWLARRCWIILDEQPSPRLRTAYNRRE